MAQIKSSTIYDVAKMAGVSSATVSRVLNDPSKVAPAKQKLVQDAIDELHFVPKADAVINARKAYKKIGVIAPFFTQPSFMERLRGVSAVLASLHYELVIYSIDTVSDLDNYIKMLVTANRIDGLIAFCINFTDEQLKTLSKARFPVCAVENEIEGMDCVMVPNLKGGQKAAELLYSLGCTKPGFIGERSTLAFSVTSTEERFQGFRFFFANQGIIIPENHVWMGEFTEQNLEKGISSFLAQDDLPDGIFCSSDVIAAKFLRLASNKGIRVPDDIKVLGFDNIDLADYIGLSSISQELDDSGRIAAELVLSRIANPTRENRHVLSLLKVIQRGTTG